MMLVPGSGFGFLMLPLLFLVAWVIQNTIMKFFSNRALSPNAA